MQCCAMLWVTIRVGVTGPIDILAASVHSELAGCAVALHPAEPF